MKTVLTTTPEKAAAAIVSAFKRSNDGNIFGVHGECCTEALMTMFQIKQARAEEYLLAATAKMREGIKTSDDILKGMLSQVWNYIASDALTAGGEGGDKFTNAMASECILDASRLETMAAKTDEEKAVLREFRKLAWSTQCRKVRKLLGRLV